MKTLTPSKRLKKAQKFLDQLNSYLTKMNRAIVDDTIYNGYIYGTFDKFDLVEDIAKYYQVDPFDLIDPTCKALRFYAFENERGETFWLWVSSGEHVSKTLPLSRRWGIELYQGEPGDESALIFTTEVVARDWDTAVILGKEAVIDAGWDIGEPVNTETSEEEQGENKE
ncbi:hypothetical protein [Schaalia sp. ZJ1691]|uniref:hypothetical protein n=1 Tax=Schaalia sp. ZJ1691 TaxID=2709404 RepID=UPI0013EC1AAE|nr:hypothetical protein [Schaalia sp. ZJ1691]